MRQFARKNRELTPEEGVIRMSNGARGVKTRQAAQRQASGEECKQHLYRNLSTQSACAARNHCRFETTWARGVAASQRRTIW
ncbi:hypothetical protein VE00_03806 [Pseudogymnoascus sp. WSF 3629]|nr:hypothetical protein VE00_03806 [Pseudogymnoascus sp. WSF 3629]